MEKYGSLNILKLDRFHTDHYKVTYFNSTRYNFLLSLKSEFVDVPNLFLPLASRYIKNFFTRCFRKILNV